MAAYVFSCDVFCAKDFVGFEVLIFESQQEHKQFNSMMLLKDCLGCL